MSGILGLWNLDGCPVDPALLAGLSALLAHRGPDGEGRWLGGPVGFACRNFWVTPESVGETQPLVHSSGVVVVFDGRLDNRDELLASLGQFPEASPQSSDSLLVAVAYVAFGDAFAERLNGDFALGLFDPNRRQLLLARDALGVRPLYYSRAGQAFLFASEIKPILAHPNVKVRPDDDAIADFLLGARDLFRRGRTFFNEVRAVLPGEMLRLTPERLQVSQYWDFDPGRRIRFPSFHDYTEAFRQHFETAVRRRMRSAYPVAVALSGGLDSSSVFCVGESLRRLDPRLCPQLVGASCVYEDGTPADEKMFLLEIERQYGCSVARFPFRHLAFLAGGREAAWRQEAPFLNVQWKAYDELVASIHRLGARVLLTGDWGDQILFDQAYLVDLFRGLKWRRMLQHFREFPRWLEDADPESFQHQFVRGMVRYNLPHGLVQLIRRLRKRAVEVHANQAWYSDGFRARARESAYWVGPSPDRAATVHARSIYEQARMGHHLLQLERHNKIGAQYALDTAFPFMDRDLVSFLMAIPGQVQTLDGVPKALLRQSLAGVVPAAILERRSKADQTDLVNQAVEAEFPEVAKYLDTHLLADRMGYLDGQIVRQRLGLLKERIRGRDCLTSWSIRDMLGLEMWLEAFFGGESQRGIPLAAPTKHS
jgi:asparagine synthase (glutamine-hydrolysing)